MEKKDSTLGDISLVLGICALAVAMMNASANPVHASVGDVLSAMKRDVVDASRPAVQTLKRVLHYQEPGQRFTAPGQSEPERYPGQAEHGKPPEGWYCEHQTKGLTVDPVHVCECHRYRICRMPDDGGEDGEVGEDSHCQVWCHPTHCHCPIGDGCSTM